MSRPDKDYKDHEKKEPLQTVVDQKLKLEFIGELKKQDSE